MALPSHSPSQRLAGCWLFYSSIIISNICFVNGVLSFDVLSPSHSYCRCSSHRIWLSLFCTLSIYYHCCFDVSMVLCKLFLGFSLPKYIIYTFHRIQFFVYSFLKFFDFLYSILIIGCYDILLFWL